MEQYKDLIEVLDLGFALAMGVSESLKDGDIDIWDAKNFLPVVKKVKPAIDDISKIPGSLMELDDEGRLYICNHFKEKFDLEDDKLEENVERILDVVMGIIQFVGGLKKK